VKELRTYAIYGAFLAGTIYGLYTLLSKSDENRDAQLHTIQTEISKNAGELHFLRDYVEKQEVLQSELRRSDSEERGRMFDQITLLAREFHANSFAVTHGDSAMYWRTEALIVGLRQDFEDGQKSIEELQEQVDAILEYAQVPDTLVKTIRDTTVVIKKPPKWKIWE
jgi:hypothetical protein